MYTHVWTKYLPIIRILAKRASTAEQTLDMNATDFNRAGAGRKVSYKFSIRFRNGRLEDNMNPSPVAKDLLVVLLQDDVIKDLFRQNRYQVDMNAKFQLLITQLPNETVAEAVADTQSVAQD